MFRNHLNTALSKKAENPNIQTKLGSPHRKTSSTKSMCREMTSLKADEESLLISFRTVVEVDFPAHLLPPDGQKGRLGSESLPLTAYFCISVLY